MSKLSNNEKELLTRAIKDECRSTADARYLHRLHCVQLVAQGHKSFDVAGWFYDDPSSVSRWVRHYKTFGEDGLRDDQRTGRLSKLDYDQMQSLKKELKREPLACGYNKSAWDGRLLETHLLKQYNTEYSLRQCQRLMRQIRESLSATETCERLE